MKNSDDETLKYMGKIMQFTVKLRKWIVYEHNKDKKSPMIPKMLKVTPPPHARPSYRAQSLTLNRSCCPRSAWNWTCMREDSGRRSLLTFNGSLSSTSRGSSPSQS